MLTIGTYTVTGPKSMLSETNWVTSIGRAASTQLKRHKSEGTCGFES